jgi:hypothetical protein
MLHLKEAVLRDKFDNFRQFLDSNYNASHTKLTEKLNDLTKEVHFLKENLSKNVRKAVNAKKNSEKNSNPTEGKIISSILSNNNFRLETRIWSYIE